MCLLSPLIHFFLRKFGLGGVILLGLFYVSGIWFDIHGLSIISIFFFSLGGYFRIYKKDLCVTLYNNRYIYYGLFLTLFPLMVYLDGYQTYGGISVFILFGVLSLFCISYYFVNCGLKIRPMLKKSTFFVYAFHVFILGDCVRTINFVISPQTGTQFIIAFCLVVVLEISICVLLYSFLNYCFPSICRILTGGRS